VSRLGKDQPGHPDQEDFELLVAQAREDGTRNDDMTLVRLTRRAGRQGRASTMATWPISPTTMRPFNSRSAR